MAKKIITITLRVGDLIYNIRNHIYHIGETMEAAGTEAAAVGHMQDTDSRHSADFLAHKIRDAVAELRRHLGEYISDAEESKQDSSCPDKIDLRLAMPSNFRTSVLPPLQSAMGQYVETMSIAAWLAVTVTDANTVKSYIEEAARIIEEVKYLAGERERPKKETP